MARRRSPVQPPPEARSLCAQADPRRLFFQRIKVKRKKGRRWRRPSSLPRRRSPDRPPRHRFDRRQGLARPSAHRLGHHPRRCRQALARPGQANGWAARWPWQDESTGTPTDSQIGTAASLAPQPWGDAWPPLSTAVLYFLLDWWQLGRKP